MLFPALSKSYLWFTHIANYLLRTLSQQTNVHWEYNTSNVNYKIENRLSLYLETSKCFTFQSHHSKFVVTVWTVWFALEANVDFIGRSFFENFPNSCLRRWLSPRQTNWRPPACQYHLPIPCGHAEAWGGWACRLPWLNAGRSWLALKAEKERSLTALVAGMTSISLPRVQISLSRILRAFPSDWKKSSRSAISNREVPYPIACTTSGSRDSWASSLYCCRSVSPYMAITFASSSSWSSPATAFRRSSCMLW